LSLSLFDDIYARIQHTYDDYESKKRARELAKLLLQLIPNSPFKPTAVTFKASQLEYDAKITDPILNQWIRQTLHSAITTGQFPLRQFGDSVISMIGYNPTSDEPVTLDIDRLKAILKQRLIHPKNLIRKGNYQLAKAINTYLQQGTTLKATEGVDFSDEQLSFLFDLLALFKQVNVDEIASERKDFMGTLMRNQSNK
jgi:hypothetical protein